MSASVSSATVTSGPHARLARVAPGPGILTQAFTKLAAAWRLHRAVQALGTLDARGLADIGVGPGEIEAAARTGRRGARAVARTNAQPTLPPAWTEWR